MEFDQKTIFHPKFWLTLFVVMHTFLFAIWYILGPFMATDADMTKYLEEEIGLSTELAADSTIRDAFLEDGFFLGIMAMAIVPPFLATAWLLEGRPQTLMTIVCGGTLLFMVTLGTYGDVAIAGEDFTPDLIMGFAMAGATIYSGYIRLDDA
tara:strand:- start:12 stop:467 length:456 start_codon:yes stop_codon:yes gene_type:complete